MIDHMSAIGQDSKTVGSKLTIPLLTRLQRHSRTTRCTARGVLWYERVVPFAPLEVVRPNRKGAFATRAAETGACQPLYSE